MVYCVQLSCEYDELKRNCRLYDPSPSFFARFNGDGPPSGGGE
jgi:hypothetical protein